MRTDKNKIEGEKNILSHCQASYMPLNHFAMWNSYIATWLWALAPRTWYTGEGKEMSLNSAGEVGSELNPNLLEKCLKV